MQNEIAVATYSYDGINNALTAREAAEISASSVGGKFCLPVLPSPADAVDLSIVEHAKLYRPATFRDRAGALNEDTGYPPDLDSMHWIPNSAVTT